MAAGVAIQVEQRADVCDQQRQHGRQALVEPQHHLVASVVESELQPADVDIFPRASPAVTDADGAPIKPASAQRHHLFGAAHHMLREGNPSSLPRGRAGGSPGAR